MKVIIKVGRSDSDIFGDCDFLISGELGFFFHNINAGLAWLLDRYNVILTNDVVLTISVRCGGCSLIPHLRATVPGHRLVVADDAFLLGSGNGGVLNM
jgi:hypothetical protein